MWGGWGNRNPSSPPHTLHSYSKTYARKLTTNSAEYRIQIQNIEYRIQKLVDIKLPMYLYFYMMLGLIDFDAGKFITRPLEGVDPENLDFFGPKWHSLRSLPFQGPK